jgi:hypothetical protein
VIVNPRAEYLVRRLAALREELPVALDARHAWFDEDIQDVILEAAEYLRLALDLPRLDDELVGRSRIDTKAIGQVLGWLRVEAEKTPPPYGLTSPDGKELEWRERLTRLEGLARGLEGAEALGELEVSLRLAVAGDGPFDTLLVALTSESPVRGQIVEAIRAKLNIADDKLVMDLWTHLRAETDPSREVHIDVDVSIVPPSFFDLGDPTSARDRIARYLADVRPRLERRMMERGISRFPADAAGAISILSWTSTPSTHAWSMTDRVAIRSLGRVCDCWTGSKDTLAATLGVRVNGYFVGGRAEQEAKRSRDRLGRGAPPPGARRALAELEKLVSIADHRSVEPERPVERALHDYKLGLEIVAPDLLSDRKMRDELRLQRQLLRFLVERGIRSYGTKLGWSETDVRSEDRFGAVVIETKVIRSGSPSAGAITKWLTQLGCYMDQEHAAVRGALVLYNFSGVPIFVPRAAIRYRYLIVAINLCPVSPSKRM